MKTVTTYIAFDDTEFDNEEACREYEIDAFDTMVELDETYHFYDKDMNRLFISAITLEEMIDNLDDAYMKCEYIYVDECPSDKVLTFVKRNLGYSLINGKGLYKYNWNEAVWEKQT